MIDPHVSLDSGKLSPAGQKLQGPLEDQLTSALKAATDRIKHRYAGEPVDDVLAQLVDETRAGLHPDIAGAWQPDHDQLYEVARAIASTR